MLIVTAALIMFENKFLIAQRKKGSHLELYWEFPGGKLEEGEAPVICLKREIMEELGIEIEVLEIYEVVYHKYEDRTVLLLCYLCNYKGGICKPLDCESFRWISKEELENYKFAPADIPVVEKLKKESNLPQKYSTNKLI